MNAPPVPRGLMQRNLHYLATPSLWPMWPFLPVMRRQPGKDEEYGVLYDCWTRSQRPGFRATVFLTNLFELPPTEAELLALPREMFDAPEEIYAAGWRVD